MRNVNTKKTGNVRINAKWIRVRVTIGAMEKPIDITYFECMSVALFIQHTTRIRRINIAICDLSGSNIYFHIIT